MKIIVLSHKFYPDIGGIEINSEIFALNLLELGAEIKVLTWSICNKKKNFPFPVIRSPSKITLIKQFLWADIIFENNPCLNLSWPALFIKRKHLVVINTWIKRIDDTIALQDRLKMWWLNKADIVIAVSEKVKSLTFMKAVVITNPYRKNLFRLLPEIKRNKHFVFLGRLVSDKGADMAIELINQLKNSPDIYNHSFGPLTLTIIGDGPDKENLREMTQNYSLHENVLFTGSLVGKELVKCLNQHKYLIVPSRWMEPFGNVVLEGMASGCIPIVSNSGGLPEAVGNAGVVFERNDQLSLLQEVVNLIKNPNLEIQLRNNIPKHLEDHTPQIVTEQYFKVLKTLNS